jgi:light-regulated signal transduction histidine kinase (bacteriophytochrome)
MTTAGRRQPLPAQAAKQGKPDSARATAALGDAVLQPEIQRLRRRVKELERKNAQLEQFAAMAAHELVKPLVMTEACATTIKERSGHGLDLASRQELESIILISSRVRLLVEALLVDARDNSGALRLQTVDLGHVVRGCLAMLARDIEAHDATVEVDPLPVVRGNAALLGGVFGNLLTNALKYSPGPGSQIQITAVRSEASWVFAVEAPGRAISDAERRSIFEPWQRGRTARQFRGMGLGLAVVRRIVERHGGEVGVTAGNESRNRFFFTLPA